MQSSKPSKKTRNTAEEKNAPVPEVSEVAEAQATKPRTSKSSKKIDSVVDAGAGKTHRKLSTPVMTETSRQASTPSEVEQPLKTAVAAAGAEQPIGGREVSSSEISELAHSYWVERGYAHGNPEHDWLRAEQELGAKR